MVHNMDEKNGEKRKPSNAVIRRLPKYYRYLQELVARETMRISSHELAAALGFTASQVRQDLNCFGGFGQQGYGYNVANLRDEIAAILGLDDRQGAVLIGAGNLGRALLGNFDFQDCGFVMLAAFDINEKIIGQEINGISVFPMEMLDDYSKRYHPAVAVLTLPPSSVSDIVDHLSELGYSGVWNFTNRDIHLSNTSLEVENVHFADSLMALRYRVK